MYLALLIIKEMKVYPLTIDLKNGNISLRRLGNAFEENDSSLTTYMDAEYRGHISRIGHIRIIRLITEEHINQNGWNKVLSWYEVGKKWNYTFEPTDLINYGEPLKIGQYVVAHFQNTHNGIIYKHFFSYEVEEFKDVEYSKRTRDNLIGVQINRPDNIPFTDGQLITHIGMLTCRKNDLTHYDEVFNSYEFLIRYQPIMHDIFDCYPRLKEINLMRP